MNQAIGLLANFGHKMSPRIPSNNFELLADVLENLALYARNFACRTCRVYLCMCEV
jgi:hypothetical protein